LGVQRHPLLTSGLHIVNWLPSCPGRFNPGVRAPSILWKGGWVDPRAGLDAVAKREKFHCCWSRKLNPGLPASSLHSTQRVLPSVFSCRFVRVFVRDD